MRKLLFPIMAVLGLAACTPHQVAVWNQWHDEDPAAAEQFVANGCSGLCTDSTPDDSGGGGGGVYWPWTELAQCESGGNWYISTGNGYYGGLQFSLSSWQAVGGSGYPHQNSPSEQVYRAERLQDLQGWGAWPACSAQIGLR